MLNLLYYDLKNTARKIFGYIFGILIFTGFVRFLWSDTFMMFFNNDNFYIADIIRWVSVGVLLCLVALIIIFVMVRQTQWFDENLLSAQGQLTNMLPVSGGYLVLSKIITAFIWSVMVLVLMLIIAGIFFFKTDRLSYMISILSDAEAMVSDKILVSLVISFSVFVVVSICAVVAQCFLSLIIGQLFNNLRNLMIFLSFVAISIIIIGIEFLVLNMFDGGIFASIKTQADAMIFCRIASLRLALMNFILIFVYWFGASRLLKTGLNLI